jgi:hypothetical protein
MKKVKITIQSKDFLIEDERELNDASIPEHIRRFKRIKYNTPNKDSSKREKYNTLSKIKFKIEIKTIQ